ncbi:hypothetical protein BC939DRAFT_139525 [Gamsiella multidivaricata]|uniref:uncharacterized protein n=1 Tax=Gamsiella multidivaricata TaxID=101098 RepID=UPI0022200C70|nr:uncharacterized protein BC939DRAFT_139525 [Gamsiella multidivaricata]KAI7824700.1 hypothetical protein BC939DRAFT_139525 [Gamsiella multidivaricata]
MSRMSYHSHQREDLESVSDGQSDLMGQQQIRTIAEMQHASVLASEAYTRALQNSVLIPAAVVRESHRFGAHGRRYSQEAQSPVKYMHQGQECNESMFHVDRYDGYYNQNEGEKGSERAYLAEVCSPASAATTIASLAHAFAPKAERSGALMCSDSKGRVQRRRSNFEPVEAAVQARKHLHQHPSLYQRHPAHRRVSFSLQQQQQQQLGYRQACTSSPISPFEQVGYDQYDDPFRDGLAYASYSNQRSHVQAQAWSHPYLDPQTQCRTNLEADVLVGPPVAATHEHLIHVPKTTTTTTHSAPVSANISRCPPVEVPEYRRPQSFAFGSGCSTELDNDEMPVVHRYRTHVLDEGDSESLDSEIELTNSKYATYSKQERQHQVSRGMSPGKLLSGSLGKQFRRLSMPYVQSIRQQQQGAAGSVAYLEERDAKLGMMRKGENGREEVGPVPEQANGSQGRRWSRGLLRSMVESLNHHGSGVTNLCGGGEGGGEGRMKEVHADGDENLIAAGRREEGGTEGGGYGHKQVHSGSLASFRGLEDPEHPRLRVMNPDDGIV